MMTMRSITAKLLSLTVAITLGCASIDTQLTDMFQRNVVLADQGDNRAAFVVGRSYYFGYYVAEDDSKLAYFKDVPRDDQLAYKYLKQSAAGGNPLGATLAGILVMAGRGTEKNDNEAIALFEQGKDKYLEARYFLAQYYAMSNSPVKQAEGYQLVANARSTKSPEMLDTLALFYEKGIAVKQDKSMATGLKKQANTLRDEQTEFLKKKLAAMEDARARARKYGAVVSAETERLQGVNLLISIVGVAAFAAATTNGFKVNPLAPPPPPPPSGLTAMQMIKLGIIK